MPVHARRRWGPLVLVGAVSATLALTACGSGERELAAPAGVIEAPAQPTTTTVPTTEEPTTEAPTTEPPTTEQPTTARESAERRYATVNPYTGETEREFAFTPTEAIVSPFAARSRHERLVQ